MPTDADRERLVAAAEAREGETTEFLSRLVRAPSVNPPGEYAAVVDELVSTYDSYGWDVDAERAPESLLDDLALPHPRPNVFATVCEGDGPTIVLNAHHDTVPVDEADWTRAPFGATVEDGRLYGRGATDSKGRIASYTLAARALESTDLLPDATVVLAITADEETGGEAGAGYVAAEHCQPDYAVVEGSSETVWNAACGVLHFRVDVTGSAAHAGSPERGENAILGATRLLTALDEYATELRECGSDVTGVDGPTCTPGTVEGGTKTNIVPASCSFTVDRRVPPDEDVDAAEADFRERVSHVADDLAVDVAVETVLRAEPYHFDREDGHVQAMKRNAEAILDREVPVEGTQGFTDARFFAAEGTKCVHFGPGDEESNAHGADESVDLGQVRDAGAVVAASVLDMAELGRP
jgi:acetylornithine deacetylase/succinyl-diaminopimelate desuccinylase family protein